MLSKADIEKAARAKWQGSGLSDAQAKKLRLEPLVAEKVAKLGASFRPAGGVRIPYFSLDGRPTSFFRLRYLEQFAGFAGLVEKPQRYVQPAGTVNEVYLPPLLPRKWTSVLDDTQIRVVFTEGEFKSACACARGYWTIGLGGVDVWRAGRRGLELLPALEKFAWANRQVVIAFDSDAATNPNVVAAQRRLARELAGRGALPHIIALPQRADGSKQGLDDYLIAHENAHFDALIEEAPVWSEAEALWEMNEEVVYIRDPGMVVVRASGQAVKPGDFKAHAYANRFYSAPNAEGVAKRYATAKSWLEWEHRFELERVTYEPGKPRVTNDKFNQWEQWGCVPQKGDVRPWTKLLDRLFQSAKSGEREYFEQWCAYPLQHPGTKMFVSTLLWGIVHGTGKSLAGYTLSDIYGKNAIEISDDALHNQFTEWAHNKQFVMGDEITGSDKRADANRMKRLITQEAMRINIKWLPSYVVPDCINYYFTSNQPDAFFLEDADRRYFIIEIVGDPLSDGFYQEYDRWRRSGGASYLFHYLLNLDTSKFNPRAPALSTAAKRAMIMDNKSDLATWCAALREDPAGVLRTCFNGASEKCDLYTSAQLLMAYSPDRATIVTSNGLGRELKRAGFRQVNDGATIRVDSGCYRLYAIRNPDRWLKAPPGLCAKHWQESFAPKGDKF